MQFCTLGMFIIDDIYPSPSHRDQTPKTDIIGGAGTYSAIGARLLSPSPSSKFVGWIVDAGTDFPDELRSIIASWETGVLFRHRDALTTRGWNGYGENEHRAFKYLTEKKRLTADDLTPELLEAKSFHLICSPLRCIELVARIKARQLETLGARAKAPIFIWEPVPDLCTEAELHNTLVALSHVDVVSPNHEELGNLFGYSHESGVDAAIIEWHVAKLTAHGIGPAGKGAVVVRAGKEGCYVAWANGNAQAPWLPPYHTDQSKVIDPTGGGNGFLGGLAIGLVRTHDIVTACAYGSVAASLCIEQVGMPELTIGADGKERWNGVDVLDRLREYQSSIGH